MSRKSYCFRYLIKGVRGVSRRPQVEFLEDHQVLCQRPSLVREQVVDSAQLLGDCRGSGHSPGDVLVPLDVPRVEDLADVQVDAERDGG